MFSGKSTELIRMVRRSRIIGKKVMVVNHRMDNRYTDKETVVSHSGHNVPGIKVNKLSELEKLDLEQPDIIAIDEAQFFDDLTEQVMHFVEDLGISVIVAGLSGDYQRKPFGSILELVPKCDNLVFTQAYCSSCNDGTHASFTKRLVQEDGQTLVGDKTKYAAMRRECYINSP